MMDDIDAYMATFNSNDELNLEGLVGEAVGAEWLGDYEFATSGSYTVTHLGDEGEYYTIKEGKTMTIAITATIHEEYDNAILAGFAIRAVQFGTDNQSDATRAVNVMTWSNLLDSLKTSKTTLIGTAEED